jgi:hypothetical protein
MSTGRGKNMVKTKNKVTFSVLLMENRSSSPTCIEDRGQHASTHLTSSSLFNNIRSKLGSVVDPE